MTLAFALGRRGLGRAWPNPAVGAVIVKDGVVVGRGWTQPGGRPPAETEALRRVAAGRPQVMLNLAVSADGKVARSGRRPVEITGEAARSRVYLMRSRSDAVLTGIGTVLADDPMLTSRLPGISSPARVVLDST